MGDVTVASTTDTQDQVNQAAGGVPQDEEQPELKAPPSGDQQVDSETQEAPPEPEKKEEKHEAAKVPRGVDKRIDKLTREKNELAAKVAALEAKQNGSHADTVDNQRTAPEVPTEIAAKFDTFDAWSEKQLAAGKAANIDDFLEARDTWKDARRAQQEEKEAAAQYQAEIASTYNEKVEAFKAEHDDWEEVVGGTELVIPPGVGPAILELENGPEVTYWLATHPKEAKELNELSPFRAVAEIGRIAARLEKAEPESPTNNATNSKSPDRMPIVSSKAPPPIRPLGGNALRSQNRDYNSMSQDEYNKLRDAEEKAARRR